MAEHRDEIDELYEEWSELIRQVASWGDFTAHRIKQIADGATPTPSEIRKLALLALASKIYMRLSNTMMKELHSLTHGLIERLKEWDGAEHMMRTMIRQGSQDDATGEKT